MAQPSLLLIGWRLFKRFFNDNSLKGKKILSFLFFPVDRRRQENKFMLFVSVLFIQSDLWLFFPSCPHGDLRFRASSCHHEFIMNPDS